MPLPPLSRSTRAPRWPVAAALLLGVACTASAPGVLRISRGDTLSQIALRYHTTVAELKSANGLGASDRIYAGQTLTLPGAATAANKGVPAAVIASAAQHRATLSSRPLPSKTQARALVASTARRHGVDASLALAVAYQESGFQQRVVSPVDAIGVMQVLPSTGRSLAGQAGRPLDLLRTEDNITAGVLLLQRLRATTGSDDGALIGYYQGLGSVAAKGVLPQTTAYLTSIHALRPRFGSG